MLHLKSKSGSGLDRKFAVLIWPKLSPHQINNDEEMYSEVTKRGEAVIKQFDTDMVTLKAEETLKPTEFEAAWMGD